MRERRQTSLEMSEEGQGFRGELEVLLPEGDMRGLSRGGAWRDRTLKGRRPEDHEDANLMMPRQPPLFVAAQSSSLQRIRQ